MRRTPLLVPLVLAVFSLSCGDAPTAVQDEAIQTAEAAAQLSPTLLLAGKGNGAEVIWAPFSFQVQGCEGEENVLVEGFSHTVRKYLVPGQRNQHAFLTVNAQGVGTGQLTGAEYVWADKVTSYHYRGNGKGSGLKRHTNSRLIGQGSAPNLRFSLKITHIVNANGEVTVDVNEAHRICK